MTKYNKYITEEEANEILIEGKNLYRQWFQMEMPIRQDIADQLMDFEGTYINGKKKVKLSGESLYFAFSKLCRLVDYKSSDLSTDRKSYVVYSGYTETNIVKKTLKMSTAKWNGIKKLLYNCGLLDIVKRTYLWELNGQKMNGTRNVFIINRIPAYTQENEYCNLDFEWRDYDTDRLNNTLSKQFIEKDPYESIRKNYNAKKSISKSTEFSTVEKSVESVETTENKADFSTMENSTMENSTMENSIVERHINNIYNILNKYINNKDIINNPSINQIDGMNEFNQIIDQCELYCLNSKTKSKTVKSALFNMYFLGIKMNGVTLPKQFVREQMKKLNHFIIEYALECFENASKKTSISNPLAYIQSCIFNAISSHDLKIQADVNYDLNNDIQYNCNKQVVGMDKITLPEEEDFILEQRNENKNTQKEVVVAPILERYKDTEFELPLLNIKNELTSASFNNFINNIISIAVINKTLIVKVPNEFLKKILERSYKELLNREFKTNSVEIKIAVE